MSESTSQSKIQLPSDPTLNLESATKQYVDNQLSSKVSKSGDTMTGALFLPTGIAVSQNNQVPDKAYVDSSISTGGSGSLTATNVSFTPYGDISSTNVQVGMEQLDNIKLNLSGGTLTGPLTLSADPSSSLQSTTKQYADRQGTKPMAFTANTYPYSATLTHSLGRQPNVMIELSTGVMALGDWVYSTTDPLNTLTLNFSKATSGTAILT